MASTSTALVVRGQGPHRQGGGFDPGLGWGGKGLRAAQYNAGVWMQSSAVPAAQQFLKKHLGAYSTLPNRALPAVGSMLTHPGTTIKNNISNPWYRKVDKWMGRATNPYQAGSYKRVVSRALKAPGSPLSLAFTGLFMYQGYQEGGIGGALRAGAESVGYEMVGSLAFESLKWAGGGALVGGLAVAGAAAYGTYEALEYGNRYMKSRTRTEMSDPYVDKFGTIATMRQRSLQAMRDSHLNMRSALGNEATLLHR